MAQTRGEKGVLAWEVSLAGPCSTRVKHTLFVSTLPHLHTRRLDTNHTSGTAFSADDYNLGYSHAKFQVRGQGGVQCGAARGQVSEGAARVGAERGHWAGGRNAAGGRVQRRGRLGGGAVTTEA